MKITMERYREAREGYEGWCTECQDFTTFECEPDAEEYECDRCGEPTVMGVEEALMNCLFEIV